MIGLERHGVIQSIDSGILVLYLRVLEVQKRTRHIMWEPVIHSIVKQKDFQGEGGGVEKWKQDERNEGVSRTVWRTTV